MAKILYAVLNQHRPDPGIPNESASRAFGISLHPGLVDENKLRGRDPAPMGLPSRPLSRHVRTRLFLSQSRFF
jgi:hypothetical protein